MVSATINRIKAFAESKPVKGKTRKVKPYDNLKQFALTYITLAILASCGLNALANAKHADADCKLFAYILGGLIPVFVLLLGRIGGLLWKRSQMMLAKIVASVAILVLLLSVLHCTESIAMLTGSHWLLAFLMALGIDCGLVACEIVSVIAE